MKPVTRLSPAMDGVWEWEWEWESVSHGHNPEGKGMGLVDGSYHDAFAELDCAAPGREAALD